MFIADQFHPGHPGPHGRFPWHWRHSHRHGPPGPPPLPSPPTIKECYKLHTGSDVNLTLSASVFSSVFIDPALTAASISFIRDGPAGLPPRHEHKPKNNDIDAVTEGEDKNKEDDKKPCGPKVFQLPVTISRKPTKLTGLIDTESTLQVCILSTSTPHHGADAASPPPPGPPGRGRGGRPGRGGPQRPGAEGLALYDSQVRKINPKDDAEILALVSVAVHLPEGFPLSLVGFHGPPLPHHRGPPPPEPKVRGGRI